MSESDPQTVTFRVNDPELKSLLDDTDNRSELLRQALREFERDDAPGPDTLTEHEREAYQWCYRNVRNRTKREHVTNELAQVLGISKVYVKNEVLQSLDRQGLIEHHVGMESVAISVVRDGREA